MERVARLLAQERSELFSEAATQKGTTSRSKVYHLVERFSEDIEWG